MSREIRDRADVMIRELREMLVPISAEIRAHRVHGGHEHLKGQTNSK